MSDLAPNTYPLPLSLAGCAATILVYDDTPEPDSRNNGRAFTSNGNERSAACYVTGTGTVNRIPVSFSIRLEWRAKYNAVTGERSTTEQELTWTGGYSQVRRNDGSISNDAPDGARAKVLQAVEAAATTFLRAHPEAVRAARSTALHTAAQRAKDAVAELHKQLAEAVKAMAVANQAAEAWDAGRALTYNVHVYETAGWGNRYSFERRYAIVAVTPHAAAMAGLARAEREQPTERHERRYALASTSAVPELAPELVDA